MTELGSLRDEYPQRIARARELMEEGGLDALLLFTGPNLVYFTGATGMLGGRSGSRPFIYLLPRQGEPTLIVHDGRQFEARALTDVADIRTYPRLSRLPLETVLGAIEDHNLKQGRIGAELGGEMVLDLPFGEFMRLQAALQQVEWEDASTLLWAMRMVKSEGEIARVAQACAITSEAYARTFEAIVPGMTEAEIERTMWGNMLALGGASPWVMLTSGPGNYDVLMKGGTARVVEPGDMVWMDCGCAIDGYWSDFGRAGVVGGPSAEQKEAQRAIREITQIGVEMVRPGVPVAEIAQRCNEALKALDLPITSNISGLADRVGHGLGMNITELPSLNEEDSTVLEPGMIVTIEPGVATEYGTFHIEENVLVTDEEPRVLSSPHWQLWSIPV